MTSDTKKCILGGETTWVVHKRGCVIHDMNVYITCMMYLYNKLSNFDNFVRLSDCQKSKIFNFSVFCQQLYSQEVLLLHVTKRKFLISNYPGGGEVGCIISNYPGGEVRMHHF